MADKKIIGIDLGHETLKCITLSVASGKPEIIDSKAVSLNLSIDADETSWSSAVVNVLNSWKETGLIGQEDEICVTVPNDQVLIRALKINTEDIKTQLGAEADKQIPVSISEVHWDTFTISEDDGQSHLVLAAVKKELVDKIISIFNKAGLEPSALDCGPTAIGNLYLYANGGEAATPVAILSIGSTASDLVVVDGKKIWIRNIPVTGKAIVSSIVKNLNISEEEAKTAISKINLAAQAGDESDILKNVRATMTRIVMEITRSLTFFKAQIGGEKPQKVLVCGGYSNIPGLTDFLAARLKIEAGSLNVFQGIDGAAAENAFLFPQALGCALGGAGLTPYSINILPKDVQIQHMLDRKKVWITAAAYIFAAMFIVLFAVTKMKSAPIDKEAKKAEAALSKVSALNNQIKKIQKEIDSKQLEIDDLHRVILSRDILVKTINDISKIIPSNMWIRSIENVSFGDIYERENMDNEDIGPAAIIVDEKSELYTRPVRLLIRGGFYGDWTAAMPKLQEAFAKIPGIAGFTQRQLVKEKKYSIFEIDVDLDVNYNDKADLADIKEAHARKGRSGRR